MLETVLRRLPDRTPALLADPYRFVSRRAREEDSDVFTERLLGQETICLTGPEAAELLYDDTRFSREGAAPPPVQKTLFGEGGVQGLDGLDHRHRKGLFREPMDPDRIELLADLVQGHWQRRIEAWSSTPRPIELYAELRELLTRSVCEWAGVPLPESEVDRHTRDLSLLFDGAGALNLRHLRSRRARARAERWAAIVVKDVRDGRTHPPPRSALRVVAEHRDLDGELLTPEVAAVELLNVLRPTVAVSVYMTFVAHALQAHPQWRPRLADPQEGDEERFVEEVRRWYPFFPVVAAVVREDFEWRGHRFPAGTRTLLDLYGTNHDPRTWERPEKFDPDRFVRKCPHSYELIPQGGGLPARHHRCPGEDIATRLMKVAVDVLVRKIAYEAAESNLEIDFARLPALPGGGFRIRRVRRLRTHEHVIADGYAGG